jgi:hypothetical protein
MRATFEVLTAAMKQLPSLLRRHRVNRQMARSTDVFGRTCLPSSSGSNSPKHFNLETALTDIPKYLNLSLLCVPTRHVRQTRWEFRHNFRLPTRCKYLRSSVRLRCVHWQLLTAASGQPIGTIFRVNTWQSFGHQSILVLYWRILRGYITQICTCSLAPKQSIPRLCGTPPWFHPWKRQDILCRSVSALVQCYRSPLKIIGFLYDAFFNTSSSSSILLTGNLNKPAHRIKRVSLNTTSTLID